MDTDNSVGIDCGSGGMRWAEEGKGGKIGTAVNRITIKSDF